MVAFVSAVVKNACEIIVSTGSNKHVITFFSFQFEDFKHQFEASFCYFNLQ